MRWGKLKASHAHPRPTLGHKGNLLFTLKFYIHSWQSIESSTMALSIKDPEVDQMARRLARERQTTMTGAIKLALGNELNRGERFSPEERARRTAAITEIQQRIARQGIDWSMTEDEILGYDENGLPN